MCVCGFSTAPSVLSSASLVSTCFMSNEKFLEKPLSEGRSLWGP